MAAFLNSPARGKLALLMTLLVASYLAVLLDMPILRQVLGFVFLTFIPGYIILCILKLNKLGSGERFVLSIGLSLFFSIFFGLVVNTLYFSCGYLTPLSTNSLLSSFSIILLILCIICYKTNTEAFSFHIIEFKTNTIENAFLLLPSILPFLSIYGIHEMNAFDNNTVLMALLFIIPANFALVVVLNQKIPERIFPAIIFLMGISIILMYSLRSNHIIGFDAHQEYYLFRMTNTHQHWQLFIRSNLDSCLSISLLPAIYQSIMNIAPECLFKIFYSLMFSISSLVVYIISKKYVSSLYAFFASFYFISIQDFALTPLLARSNMAILFFGIAIMVIFQDEINDLNKRILLFIFLFCIIISHYSTTYVLLFILLVSWMGGQVFTRNIFYRRELSVENGSPFAPISQVESNALISRNMFSEHPFRFKISNVILIFFFVVLFLWYSQITNTAFDSGMTFIESSIVSLHDLFILESRSTTVLSALGQSENFRSSIVAKIAFVIYWLSIVLITTGVLATLVRYRERLSNFPGYIIPKYPSKKIDAEFFLLSLACCIMLVISLVVPVISTQYSVNRQYTFAMVLLSLFLVLGAITITKYVRLKPQWFLAIFLVLYFLCTSGALYQIAGTPSALILNSEGIQYNMLYICDGESYAAKWLGNHREDNITIYGDRVVPRWLLSQAGISSGVDTSLSLLEKGKKIDGYIYLRSHNIVNGMLMNITFEDCDMTEYNDKFIKKFKCYNSGGAEVWT